MTRVGLIGYGYWGPNLARCFAEHERCEFVAVYDRDPSAMERATKKRSWLRRCGSAQELIEDPTIDAVAIATPVSTHFPLALAALRAGKHVLVEKPLAASVHEASELVAEARRAQCVLMVDHVFVFTPAVQRIKQLVDDGEIGDLYYYDSVRINLGLFHSDVNVIWDLAVHDLAILWYMMRRPPAWIAAQAARHIAVRPESMAFITLGYESGAVAHINVNWLAPVKVRQTLIGGSRRMILFDDLEPSEKVKVYDKGVQLISDRRDAEELRIGYRSGDMWAPQLSTGEPLRNAIEHFLNCIDTDETPITDGVAGLATVQLLEAASQSIRQGGRRMNLEAARMAS